MENIIKGFGSSADTSEVIRSIVENIIKGFGSSADTSEVIRSIEVKKEIT